MKKTILDPGSRSIILTRISNFKVDAPALWGKMNAAQCICHLGDQFRMALGQLKVNGKPSFIGRTFIKTIVLAGLPMPKGKAQTAPELDQQTAGTKPTTFDADRKKLVALFQEFIATNDHFAYQIHPFFGHMSKQQWSKLMWMHLDHHLSQFGA